MKGFLNHSSDVRKLLSMLANERKTGELLLQRGEENAKVYYHEGLVVWAFASGQRESFQSILLKENRLARDQLLEGIKEARRTGKKNLDEILAVIGISDQKERRAIVERHTRAAIEVIVLFSECAVQLNEHLPAPDGNHDGMRIESLLPPPTEQRAATERKAAHYRTEVVATPVADIPELLERLRIEIPQFLAAMVVEGRTSMPIATLSEAPNLDPEVIGAFSQNLLRSAVDACKTLGSGETDILEEVMISTKNDFTILRSLKNGSHFLYVLIDQTSNPGMAKVAIRRYLEQLNSMLQ